MTVSLARDTLTRLRVSRATLCLALGVSPSTLRRWLRGGTTHPRDAQRLAALRSLVVTDTLIIASFERAKLPRVNRKRSPTPHT